MKNAGDVLVRRDSEFGLLRNIEKRMQILGEIFGGMPGGGLSDDYLGRLLGTHGDLGTGRRKHGLDVPRGDFLPDRVLEDRYQRASVVQSHGARIDVRQNAVIRGNTFQ